MRATAASSLLVMALLAGCGASQKPSHAPPPEHPGPEVSARWLALPVADVLARHLVLPPDVAGAYVYPAGADDVPSEPARITGISYTRACFSIGAADCFPLWQRHAPAGRRILVVSAPGPEQQDRHDWVPWSALEPAPAALRTRLGPAAAATDPDLLALDYLIAHGQLASEVLWIDTASAAPVVHPAFPDALLVPLDAKDPAPVLEKRADVPLATFGVIDSESFDRWRAGLGDTWSWHISGNERSLSDERIAVGMPVERAVLLVGALASRLRVRPLANGFLIDRPHYYLGECTSGPTIETTVFIGERNFVVDSRDDVRSRPQCR